ncbi:MAG TPA: anti-sigma factor [Fimbriimonadaceae bacterium]|nr:anti-sigma factor [Fimbriimonadaceae bacterium]
MNCNHVQRLLCDFVDGELAGNQMLAVRRHLNDCPACSAERDEIVAVKSTVANLFVPECPQGLESRLMAAIANESTSYMPRRSYRPVWAVCAAAAACLAFLAVANRPEQKTLQATGVVPYEIARDQAYSGGGDSLSGHYPIMPVSHGSR